MNSLRLFIVSDSVGETGELVAKAAISQYLNADQNAVLKRFPYIDSIEHLQEIIKLAVAQQAFIVYTLVSQDLRDYMQVETAKFRVTAVDLMGPLLDALAQELNARPLQEAGLVRKLDDDYFKKVEAIEFAVKYDDGRDPRGILMADIVLVGISRTSKTPLSQYLAHKRLKVANVPLVPEVDPPEELYHVDPKKCFGLIISPDKLNHIRKERLIALGLNDDANYAKIDRIHEEIDHFHKVVDRIGCEIVDVTNRAVEETANLILSKRQK
ncbi:MULTISPECIES: pyruvate, water dikinase regulatory protein [Planococcus]|uniref:Putative pyruvate, phosphate dikinase regulatory protein n=2 Tax=Planococcus TaxID=1372 RepID=A0ABM5WX25_9BACL|nr:MULTISPECIES: pyruvate, water dikinase regulatory protein [Planococcus]ALS78897.1 phosphoenolpyruvate synthase regulatory protein [Planococcus kocurii]AQU79146.1 phosphoenolpyruvate synthase regulatory protein [Planococcus faecalis]KAA0957762.1 kinase/pyrophosphorylase [Planococcus sp. ANT_H30]MDJ0331089.1 pyruvate, water dikinase regulatory protein [Planococcus sp. S3-L1]OHX51771.1 phosphoenolpyruvate synthase regulatory protein [Planococcus faecalis]